MVKKLTKRAVVAYVRDKIRKNKFWREHSLLMIWRRKQSTEEKIAKRSLFPNGVGFSKYDVELFSRAAEALDNGLPIPKECSSAVYTRMYHYAGQAVGLMNRKKLLARMCADDVCTFEQAEQFLKDWEGKRLGK
jgi:hypothetical protein